MILITGATGYIGNNLINILPKEDIICLVRKNSNVKSLKKLNIKLVYGDLTDKESLDKALHKITAVIHLAASISGSRRELKRVNIIGTRNLVESCKKKKVKRIIVLSSMAATRKYLDNYGKSKKIVEKIIKESGLDYTILRPTIIYGKDSNSIKRITNYVKKFPFFIPVIGKGNAYLHPVDINDVTAVISKSLTNKKSIGKTYNLLGGTKISMNYFIDLISSRLNIKKLKIHIPIRSITLAITFFRTFYKNFPISKQFIKSMDQDTQGSSKKTEKDFDIKFKKLSQSFKL